MKYFTITIILLMQFALSYSQYEGYYLKLGGNYQFESTSFLDTDYMERMAYPGFFVGLGNKNVEAFFSLNGTVYHIMKSNNYYSLNANLGIDYSFFKNIFITGILTIEKQSFSSKSVKYFFGAGIGYDFYIKEQIGIRGIIYGHGFANSNRKTSISSELIFFYKLNLKKHKIN